MNSTSGISSEDPATAGPADVSSSPRQEEEETQPMSPTSPQCRADTRPAPLPRWLQLRIKASTPFNRSHRHGLEHVVMLPFNKVAKLDVHVTEIAALNFVRANTSIPVPESKPTKPSTTTLTDPYPSLIPTPYSLLTMNANLRSP